MRRGFLLDKNKGEKASKQAPQQAKPVDKPAVKADNEPIRYDLQYGKVDYDSAIPKDYKPNFNVTIDATRGIIKSDRKTLVLVTIPPRGSAAALDEDNHSEWITLEATKPRVFNAPGFPKPMPQPKGGVPLYEVKMTPNMGLGVFATRDIKAGELVFAERPLLVAPANINVLELHLPLGIQYTKFMLAEYENVLGAAVNRMSEGNQAAFKALMNSHTEDGSGLLTGVQRTNGYLVDAIFDGPGSKAANDACRYSVVGHIASRINHSCVANVMRSFDLAAFSFTFTALVDIQSGEQLFYPYCQTEAPVEVRRKQLAPYGVVCECIVCTNATPENDKFRAEYSRRTSEFEYRNLVHLRDLHNNIWPNDTEFEELHKFQKMAIEQRLHNRPAYKQVLAALAFGYGKRQKYDEADAIMAQLNRLTELLKDMYT